MISRLWKSRSDLSRHQDIIPYAMVWKDSALLTALSQITENRKVWTRKPLIFRHTIFGFCLEKAILRQSLKKSLSSIFGSAPVAPPPICR